MYNWSLIDEAAMKRADPEKYRRKEIAPEAYTVGLFLDSGKTIAHNKC